MEFFLAVERDLEDFARLQVRKTPAMGRGTSKIQYVLYFDKEAADNPQVKLFHPASAGNEYLSSEQAATQALSSTLVGQARKASDTWAGLAIPPEVLLNADLTNRTVPFLFEGVTRGSGKLWLELRYEGTTLAKYAVEFRGHDTEFRIPGPRYSRIPGPRY